MKTKEKMVDIYTDDIGLRIGKSIVKKDEKKENIFIFGDSFTYGVGLEYEKTFAGIIEKQLNPINEIVIVNRGIDLNMLSYQYDYKFIKDNYFVLTNIFFFLNLLISNFDKRLKFILSFEKNSHYKVHMNNFNNSIINYLNSFKKDLKDTFNINIKKLD